MPRPKNKEELLSKSALCFEQLLKTVDSFSPKAQQAEFSPGTLNRTIRDVLAHLHHWHLLFLEWHQRGMAGEKPRMPARGYTWKQTPELNKAIREMYAAAPLSRVRTELSKSHERIHNLIHGYSNEELFTKKKYSWTGSTSMGAYLVSTTSSHYQWATKLIKRGLS